MMFLSFILVNEKKINLQAVVLDRYYLVDDLGYVFMLQQYVK